MYDIRCFISQSLIGLTLLNVAMFDTCAIAETITGQSGNVRAEISYDKPQEYQYKNVRLKIIRAGKTILAKKLPQESESDRPSGSLAGKLELPVVDLDGNKEPEVIADFFTGGAHCCVYSLIYRYDRTSNQYTKIRHEWGNAGYRLQDLDKDGLSEFESRDDRFAYAFTSYAASGYPLQIWQYRQGKMIDVTRRYPKSIAKDASENWQTYLEAKKEGDDGKGFLAAYLADKYMLGQAKEAWQQVEQVYKEGESPSETLLERSKYFAPVRKFLREIGYVKYR
ncbi:MAG: hypothetical protein ACR2LR_28530 [Hassallia sp.]